MSVVIRVLGSAGGGWSPARPTWVRTYDPNGRDGRGHWVFTTNPAWALRFENGGDAMRFWRQQSILQPLRDDGKPNRPLTAFTVEIGELTTQEGTT